MITGFINRGEKLFTTKMAGLANYWLEGKKWDYICDV
jgi:hypothetical protein